MGKQKALLFEMPFAMAEPRLANPEVGIAQVRRRGGRHSSTMEVTVLDTPDHRLLRAGVELEHRVVDGLGQWYLSAPGWGPWLPTKATHDMGAAGDLPQRFASLVRPFRRRAALGPAAALVRERHEWQLLGAEDEPLATLRADLVTVRRSGLTTSRHREVTIRPGRAGLTGAQRRHLTETLLASGGSAVDGFPGIAERIGAPATGLSDFRGPFELDRHDSFERFVQWIFARRLDRLMRADLGLRSGASDDMDTLRGPLADLLVEVRSLTFALEPAWRSALERNIRTVLDSLPSRTVHTLGEEYFAVIDDVVQGVRAPKIGDLSQQEAREVLGQRTVAGATILLDRARSLTMSSPHDRWAATLASAQQMQTLATTDRVLLGKRARRAEQAFDEVAELLQACQVPPGVEEPSIDLDWDAVSAFQEGRRYERRRQEVLAARRRFVDAWPEVEKRMHKARKS